MALEADDVNIHELLVHAIVGKGFPSYELAGEATKLGLADFTGNQWNEAWTWRREKLEALEDRALLAIWELQGGNQ